MTSNKEITVAFTGYRESKLLGRTKNKSFLAKLISNSKNEKLQDITRRTYEAVEKLYNDGCRLYITGCSDGFDLIGGQAVIDLKQKYPDVKLMAVVPFVGQEERYTIQDQATYDFVLEHSDEVVTLAEKFVSGDQYLRRNDYMLERATHIICYYDGQRGGTMYTYNRAKKAGLEIINICE